MDVILPPNEISSLRA